MDLDKAPYFVTLALALFGWSSNQVVNRIVDAPTLEYHIPDTLETLVSDGKTYHVQRITLTNLTRKKTFEDLSVILVSRKGSPLEAKLLRLRPVAPAFEGDESWAEEGGRATFTIPKLQPGGSVQVFSAFIGDNPAVFRLKSKGTVFATKTNWETWFVRNEILILTPLALVWAIVILLYMHRNWLSYRAAVAKPAYSSTNLPKEAI